LFSICIQSAIEILFGVVSHTCFAAIARQVMRAIGVARVVANGSGRVIGNYGRSINHNGWIDGRCVSLSCNQRRVVAGGCYDTFAISPNSCSLRYMSSSSTSVAPTKSTTSASSVASSQQQSATTVNRSYRYVHFFHYFPLTARLTSNTSTPSSATSSTPSQSSSQTLEEVRTSLLQTLAGSADPIRAKLFDSASYGLGVRGRIYIAEEGINAQIIVPCDTFDSFESQFRDMSNGLFANVTMYPGDQVNHPLPFDMYVHFSSFM
jgi:hypothetical protein